MADPDQAPTESRRARGRPRDWHDKTEQNTIKSLDRAMEVFEHLSRTDGQSLSAIAEALSQSPATVYRVLVTLSLRGLVEFDRAAQVWNIGAQAFLIGSAYLRRTNLVDRARPVLRRLMEETGETANLGIRKGGEVIFVGQVETHANIRAFFPPGSTSPLHASGIGKALLAEMEESALQGFLDAAPLDPFTERTLTTREGLLRDLARTRLRGFAIDDEERNLGMRCIAAPVFNAYGEAVGGLSISGPTSRVSEAATERLGDAVTRAADAVSRAMGYDPARPLAPRMG